MLALAALFLFPLSTPAVAQSPVLAIRIQSACAAGPFVIPSWCPDPGPGVVGGLERVVEVPVGVEVDLLLENRFPWYSAGPGAGLTSDAWFVVVPEKAFLRCHRAFASPSERAECPANPAFGLSIRVPVGTDYRTRFLPLEAGDYRYYDELRPSGYGVLRVKAR